MKLKRGWFLLLYVLEEAILTLESVVTLTGRPNPYEDWRTR